MIEEIRSAVEGATGEPVARVEPVAGGDIGTSFRVRVGSGSLFVKHYGGEQGPAMVSAEARGLSWLAEADALRVPAVRGTHEDPGLALLVLEWIEPGPASSGTDVALGRGLAALHDAGPARFGEGGDNFIGRLPQDNRPCDAWADFYAERRLAPLLRRAREGGLLSARSAALGDRLLSSLAERVGPAAPPARLHGDLWGGNWLCDASGAPVLVDPAAYGGHREVDLAMMRLFGGFSGRVFDAYREATVLAPDWEERIPLYQLYPLLVHLCLFGGGYAASVEAALRAST